MEKSAVITPFWMEIIAGTLIAIIIIFIIVGASSVITTAIYDNKNANEMKRFVLHTAKAITESSTETTSFMFYDPPRGQTYAMIYITPEAAKTMIESVQEYKAGVNKGVGESMLSFKPVSFLSELDEWTLKKCANAEDDACMCLFRFEESCSSDDNIYTSFEPSASQSYQWKEGFNSLDTWVKNFYFSKFYSTNTKIVLCILLVKEANCVYLEDVNANVKPCLIYYKDGPLVWISTKKNKPFLIETMSIDSMNFHGSQLGKYANITELKTMEKTKIIHSQGGYPCGQ